MAAEGPAEPKREGLAALVVRGFKWTVALRTTAQFIAWALTLLVMRLLEPEDFGLIAMVTVVTGILAVLGEMGLGATLIQIPEVTPRLQQQALGVLLLSNGGMVALLLASSPLAAWVLDEPRLPLLMAVLSLPFVATAFTVVPDAMLKRHMNFRSVSIIEFTTSLVGVGVTFGLALAGAGFWALAAGALATSFWKMLWTIWAFPVPVWPVFAWAGLTQHLRFAGNLTISSLLWLIVVDLDLMLAGSMLGVAAAGAYAVAKQLASLPLDRMSSITNQVLYPALAKSQGQPELLIAQVTRTARLLLFVIVPVAWGIACVAPEAVIGVLGEKWQDAVIPLQFMSIGIPIRLMGGFATTVAQSQGRGDIVLQNSLIMNCTIPLAFYVGSLWGLNGLASVWVSVYPAVLLFTIHRSAATFGLGAWTFFGPGMLSMAVGAAMAVLVQLARLVWEMPPDLFTLGYLVGIGVIAYVGLNLIFNRQPMKEILALIRL